jgi:putative ABC transport system permease protein
MQQTDDFLMALLDDWRNVVALALGALLVVFVVLHWRYARIVLKSLARNPLRTALTGLATAVLVFVVALIWSSLYFLDQATAEKSKDFKAIVSERWQIPSQMPFSYAQIIKDGAASKPGDVKPLDDMTWQFYGATTDRAMTRENLVFFFAMDPDKALTMLDDLDNLPADEAAELRRMAERMKQDPRCIVLGRERLRLLNKKVGERISLYTINYKDTTPPPGGQDIDLDDCEIIGVLPDGRWNQSAIMNRERLLRALDAYKAAKGHPHPMANKTLNIVWLKVATTEDYNQVARQLTESPEFSNPAIKCETASSGIASFLDAYRDLLWGVRWLLVPALLASMALVIANAISISVRERRTEMAVLKVLGFGPGTILLMVLGEALLIGSLSGFVSVGATWVLVNKVMGGIKFPVAFFPAFYIATAALWWGPLIGGLTALVGSFTPAWAARSVRVSEVFSKVT